MLQQRRSLDFFQDQSTTISYDRKGSTQFFPDEKNFDDKLTV